MADEQFEGRLFINNEYVEGSSGKTFTIASPYDGTKHSTPVHEAVNADIDAAVAAAQAALPAWKSSAAKVRQDCMNKFASLLEANASTIGAAESFSMGQPINISTLITTMSASWWRYYAGWADKVEGRLISPEHSSGDGNLRLVFYDPLGVCAGITAWNATILTASVKMAPAMAAGCTFILKSSEKSPFGALALGKLVKEAGFPPGVINIVAGPGSTGQMLAEHMKIAKISFTGSTFAGKQVQAAAARSNLKQCILELGGKSAALVFNGSNLEKAVETMSNGFLFNSGQICAATSRLLVQEEIADDFIEKLKTRFAAAGEGYGDPASSKTSLGPLADTRQLERVLNYIAQGREAGGELLVGGDRHGNTGCFVQPTIFKVDSDNVLWKEEIFGPVLVVRTFKTEEEAIELANDTTYGLAGTVFSGDVTQAIRVSKQIDTGAIGINAAGGLHPVAPFGGHKMSGIGSENGLEGIMGYVQPKTVQINLSKA